MYGWLKHQTSQYLPVRRSVSPGPPPGTRPLPRYYLTVNERVIADVPVKNPVSPAAPGLPREMGTYTFFYPQEKHRSRSGGDVCSGGRGTRRKPGIIPFG